MAEVVEIENYPEIIEISDEECEENNEKIVIICDSAISGDGDNENVTTIKEESTQTSAKTTTAANIKALDDNLPSLKAKTVKQANANLTCKKTPTTGIPKNKELKKTRRRKVNTSINGVNSVQMADSGIRNKVAKSDTASTPYATESSSQIIKHEKESATEIPIDEAETNLCCTSSNRAENNDLQNDCLSNNSPRNNSMDPGSVAELQSENPPGHLKSYDFSKLSWLKPLRNLSSPPNLQLVIIDRSHPDWKIGTNKWLMIEKRLLETLHTEMVRSNDSSIGLFDGARWQKGIKIVGCHNKKALNFIKNFIINLDKLWAGAKLDVCTMADLVRQICKVFIPPPILKTDVVLSLIKLQNPSIGSEDWEVLDERERNHGIDIWLSISEESFAHLRRLRGEIKYGINRIFIKPVI